MTVAEAKSNFYECTRNLSEWAIITLLDGKLVGSGYGYTIDTYTNLSCDRHWTFIMENYDNIDQDLDTC